MKQVISVLMVAVALMMAAPAQAQLIKFGLKGGVNLSKLDIDGGYEGNKDNSTGYFIGPMAEITLPLVGLGIDGAVWFSQRGEKDLKQQGIEVPVNLEAKKSQVAVNLGAGLKLLRKLQVGVTYQIPMGDSFELKDAGAVIGAKNKTWQVSLAYIF